VAHACNLATWRLGSLNGLRAGFLGAAVLCRSGVRAKFGATVLELWRAANSDLRSTVAGLSQMFTQNVQTEKLE